MELKQTVPNEPYPTVLGDRTRIKQILINIVGNAIKFTEKGSIELCLNGTPDETNRTYQFEISVKDTGIGIPEEKISTLFDPFTQAESSTTRRFGGTGLGLTITKQLLDLMNGTLSTTSQVGVGSTFTVHLELMAVTSEQGLNAPAGPSNISNGEQHPWESISLDGMTLMVVDDTPMNCDLVGLALDEQEITLLVANNGEEAVNLFKQQHIDLIFMDCLMPVMDGFEASKAIREHEAHTSHNTSQNSAKNKTPIIALTASASKEINERCKQSGMDDVMLKPFDFNELIKKVQFWRYQAR